MPKVPQAFYDTPRWPIALCADHLCPDSVSVSGAEINATQTFESQDTCSYIPLNCLMCFRRIVLHKEQVFASILSQSVLGWYDIHRHRFLMFMSNTCIRIKQLPPTPPHRGVPLGSCFHKNTYQYDRYRIHSTKHHFTGMGWIKLRTTHRTCLARRHDASPLWNLFI